MKTQIQGGNCIPQQEKLLLCRANPPEVAHFFSVRWFYILNEFLINLLYKNIRNIQVKKKTNYTLQVFTLIFSLLGVL